ncbi:MAG: dihydroorotate dehydrogenase electron transfer subunit [Eubacteriaceae bacterium]|jgi:dihydroorotate dehydrogenase electron transfer subunit|nr:dihydroorotate dehydrogenase electron transfer subunit [Eubacteriaceae bacterium]
MAIVLTNEEVARGVFMLTAHMPNQARAGQFYMLMPPGGEFSLKRPLSVHDATGESLTFLYRVRGRGTKNLSRALPGDSVSMDGPLGTGFFFKDIDSAFVGGGLGIAPLLFAVKRFKWMYPKRRAVAYLGFSDEAFRCEAFEAISDEVRVQVGGSVAEIVGNGVFAYYACGPEPLLRALDKKLGPEADLCVSLESRMGCGVGACYSCSVKTALGRQRVCREGPVFSARAVFYEKA